MMDEQEAVPVKKTSILVCATIAKYSTYAGKTQRTDSVYVSPQTSVATG